MYRDVKSNLPKYPNKCRLACTLHGDILNKLGHSHMADTNHSDVLRHARAIARELQVPPQAIDTVTERAVIELTKGRPELVTHWNEELLAGLEMSVRRAANALHVVVNSPFEEHESHSSFEIGLIPGDCSTEDIVTLLRALSDFHVAAGGPGLMFSIEGTSVTLAQAVPT
jgi:hypothetical protein